ncbi:3-oxoadipyl-CoA thiolase [Flavobacteriaceae bacterium]|nr:3-oxoadipyl-CoA thiolase [Flavobacteriaceae bacterium]MDB2326317.1 3-oxoadipyl-CoA thiolase [Flavobacteriaceae bacterium]MDB2329004.1 3-oxoadipyl-CoA thiolase [Flavobacteriaceae bacterium]MDB2345304.1 3-oxoadipyl-CoA thiolase [Flavobacteriaceae bacterium]MDB4642906.1 3-oxoadipyl-CoA thiolase [Flavobacteriaceae bacterium]
MKEAYIVDAIRTPIGSFRGALAQVRADDLAAIPIKALMDKFPDLPKDAIDDVILGCHNQAGEDNRNVARMALLLAGLPYSVPGETVNRLCSSGMSAVVQANRAIKSGDGDVFIAGGMEHMSRGPYVISKATNAFGNDAKMEDSSFGWRFINKKLHQMYGTDAMGITAENLAEQYSISREDQDLFAYNSQMKAVKARENGIFAEEICTVKIPQRKGDPVLVDQDEFIRPNTTIEKLATLSTVFKKEGTVTAGNASGLNDGAAAMLVVSEAALKKYNLTPKARIVASAVVGVEPKIMGIGPVYATRKVLDKAGLTLKDIDHMEFNEAFSAQALACTRKLGLEDNDPRINPNGGAIALGHPLGMSGTRILQAATNELTRSGGKFGLATMCVGVGMGYATLIERC